MNSRFYKIVRTKENQRRLVLILSLVVGLVSGLAAVLLKNTVHYTNDLITNGFDFTRGNYLYLAFPLVGIGLTILFAKYIARDDIGHGVSKILYAVSRKKGRLEAHNMYSSMIGSTFTIAFGGSMGLEAPIVLTGSSIGSFLGRRFHLNYKTIMILVGAGATGAIAGIFKAPIAAVVFSLEVLMLDLTMVTVIPLLISAATAATVSYFFLGSGVLFSFDFVQGFKITHLVYYAGLGIFTGLVSLYFTKSTMYIESKMALIKYKWQKWLVGGLLLGLLIYIFPSLYGEGYEFMHQLINNSTDGLINESLFGNFTNIVWLSLFLLLILIFKVVAMAITGGSGGVGGIFAPSLFMGAVAGVFYSRILNAFPFLHNVPEKNLALVGMAGVMAGVMHAPLTGIFLIAEFTGGYELFTPLIITSVISYLTIMIFEPHGIYTKRLAKRGELMTHHKDRNVLQMMSVKKLIETNFRTINPEGNLGDLVKIISESERNVIAVVDEENIFYGVVFVNDIRNIIFKQELYETTMVADIMFMPDPLVSSNDSMEVVAQKFQDSGNYNLPVIDDGKYIGFVSRARIFSSYRKLLKEFSDE
ncbi:MAG: chloride channel protein [Marinilabiliales bacterium]|nr:MAG: chloride channel protein [Marinilabiliales bacterium]